jgi:hypothetical protein
MRGRFLEASGKSNHADRLISRYLSHADIAGHRVSFVRTEYFENDFKLIFGKYIDINRIPSHEYREKVNSSKNALRKDIEDKLRGGAAYRYCPAWSAVEYFVYDKP